MPKIYLGKSNRANPNTVSSIRAFLTKKYDVLEYTGGTYSDTDLRRADSYICILEASTSIIGKGLHQQLTLCKSLNIPILIIYTRASGILAFVSDNFELKTIDSNSFVNHSKIVFFTLGNFGDTSDIEKRITFKNIIRDNDVTLVNKINDLGSVEKIEGKKIYILENKTHYVYTSIGNGWKVYNLPKSNFKDETLEKTAFPKQDNRIESFTTRVVKNKIKKLTPNLLLLKRLK